MALKPSIQIGDRVRAMLTKDKLGVSDGFTSVFNADVTRLLGDYFALNNDVEVNIELQSSGEYSVTINATARAVKAFSSTADFKNERNIF